jgi:hypothetical protein
VQGGVTRISAIHPATIFEKRFSTPGGPETGDDPDRQKEPEDIGKGRKLRGEPEFFFYTYP